VNTKEPQLLLEHGYVSAAQQLRQQSGTKRRAGRAFGPAVRAPEEKCVAPSDHATQRVPST